LLLAAGELAAPAPQQRLQQRKRIEHGLDGPASAATVCARHFEILFDRHSAEKSAAFGHERNAELDAPVSPHRAEVGPFE